MGADKRQEEKQPQSHLPLHPCYPRFQTSLLFLLFLLFKFLCLSRA